MRLWGRTPDNPEPYRRMVTTLLLLLFEAPPNEVAIHIVGIVGDDRACVTATAGGAVWNAIVGAAVAVVAAIVAPPAKATVKNDFDARVNADAEKNMVLYIL